MEFARFNERYFSKLKNVSINLSDLEKPGYWVVVGGFENDWLLLEFEKSQVEVPKINGHWHGVNKADWTSSLSEEQYLKAVEVLRENIARGEVYQANLCRVLSAAWPKDSDISGLANLLLKGNPAPFSAVISVFESSNFRLTKDVQIASASPELYLRREGNEIFSSPIKGTGRVASDLTEKDSAENVMIVDLVRNDISRVCQVGSVKVPNLLSVEEHPGLVHLVSTVTGELKPDVTWEEIFAATFPPGSVTGAPKISALKLIQKLEASPRGPYCGAIGWIDSFSKTAQLAVGIRTFWKDKDQLKFGTGAGITWGSNAQKEWDETELKTEKLLSLAASQNG
ncbi:MAG: chorismate-binding protein [Candidatus Nanopelagicales bacterium]